MKTHDSTEPARKRRHNLLKALSITLGCAVGLITLALLFLTFWLTPARLSELAGRRASEYFNADIRFSNLRFTLWSTFPRLCLEADSISVVSRAFDGLDAAERAQLPEGSDLLGSCSAFKGGVNLARLARGEVRLHDVVADRLRVNLVTFSDSLSNYDILPDLGQRLPRIPRISANSISITNPETISFHSRPSGLTTEIDLKELTVTETEKRDTYSLRLHGLISANADRLRLLSGFPFDLGGKISLRFNPVRFYFEDYRIGLGNVTGRATMEMNGGETPRIGEFSCSMEPFRLLQFLEMIPAAYIPGLDDIDADLTVSASARLTAPWSLKSPVLPSLRVDLDITDGHIRYSDRHRINLNLHDIRMKGSFTFDGKRPDASFAEISDLNVRGNWGSLGVRGRVENVISTPHVSARISGEADLAALGKTFPEVLPFGIKGNFRGETQVDFDISTGRKTTADDVHIRGEGTLTAPAVSLPGGGCDIRAGSATLTYESRTRRIGTDAADLYPIECSSRVAFRDGSVGGKSYRVRGKTLEVSAKALLAPGGETVRDLSGDIILREGVCTVDSVSISTGTLRLGLTSVPDPQSGKGRLGDPVFEYTGTDSLLLSRTPHTPALLTVSLPEGLTRLMLDRKTRIRLETAGTSVAIPSYPDPFRAGGLSLTTDLDSLRLRLENAECSDSRLSLVAEASGLLPFLTERRGTRLPVKLRILGDTIDFNHIARSVRNDDNGGERGERAASGRRAEKPAEERKTVTPALLIPRNIEAEIALEAAGFRYSNLMLRDIRTTMHAERGNLRIDTLRLASSFAKAGLTVGFDTGNVNDMGMRLGLDIDSLDLVRFFDKFTSLVRLCPSLKNVSGSVGLTGDVSFHIFPDMEVEMASFVAGVTLTGDDIVLRQNHFIHRVAKMMGIRHHHPIRVRNMEARMVSHDNLLEVYPFILQFDRYKLQIMGVNNYAGDLDYHVGVLHSPLPIPLGINIGGKYHTPKLSFGRTGWNEKEARRITSSVMKSFTFNFTRDLNRFGNAFVDKAASGTDM